MRALAGDSHSLAQDFRSHARARNNPHTICTYNSSGYNRNACNNLNDSVTDSNDNIGVTGSNLSTGGNVVNPGPAFPDSHQNSISDPNSPNCPYFSLGEETADFPLPSDASCENEVIFDQEITNVHSMEHFTEMDVPNFCHDTSEEDVIIEEEITENQLPIEVPKVDNDIEMDPKLPNFNATLGEPESVTNNPNCSNVYPNSEIQIQNIGSERVIAVDIQIQEDPCSFGSEQNLSDSRHESLPVMDETNIETEFEVQPENDMKTEIEMENAIAMTTEIEMNTAAEMNNEVQDNNLMHQEIDLNNGIHYDNEVHEIYTSPHRDPQAHCVFNPDQVAHTLGTNYVGISSHDTGNDSECLVSDNTIIERSLETGTSLPLPVSLPAVSDLPGFEGLGQDDDQHVLSPNLVASMETSSYSSSGWCTPPQTPPLDGPGINAMEKSRHLPPDSLYVIGSIQNQSSPMLVDTGASVTAVSSSFFNTLSPVPYLQPSLIPHIRTVSGEELPVLGKVTLTLMFHDVPYTFEVLVISNLTYPVVLGRDFLMHFGSVIDMQAHTLVLSGHPPIPLNRSSCLPPNSAAVDAPVTVHAQATFILPPLSESVIPVYSKTTLPVGSTGLIEPNSKLAERYNVCGASQLVSFSEHHTFPFRVLNPTNQPVTIYRCSTMGTFTPSAASMSVIATSDTSMLQPPVAASSQTVPLDLTGTPLTEVQQAQLRSLVAEYRDIFALSPEELGRTGLVKHRIDTGDHPPIKQRPYRVSDTQRGIIEEHVTDMLNRGIIQPSVSPWASPIILVKKKDGTDRFVVDFRRLNAVTRKDSYPLPRIDDALDALNGTKYFSTMDLMSGYWQVEMEPESREHTAFATFGGLYEFTVMPFGLTAAVPTYQRLMECVLRNLTYKICLIYLDDILVYSKTFEDHLCHLRQVFDRLRHANLKLKPSKCKFACTQVTYLGHIVSPEGIAPDDDKISAVRDFPRPHNVKTVRSFLGISNYYRRFIKDFAKIAAPLNRLLRKDQKFLWTDACEQAFKALKEALISAPILAFPNFSETFHLYTDASNDGIGATLGQFHDGKDVAIAYAGRDLNDAERNYSTTEREALAVIFGIKKFAPYLHGRKFILHTDHHSLKWLMTITDPTGRLARWSLLIQQHDFEIRHRPGASHGNADALSRRPYNFKSPPISAYDVPGVQTSRVRELQRRDPDLADLILYLESSTLPDKDSVARSLLLTIDDYFLSEDGLLFHLWTPRGPRHTSTYQQLVIPTALRYEILTWGHDDAMTGGHFGTVKTYEKLRIRYYWRHMYSDIQHWCRSCCDCAMKKTPRNRHKAPLLPIPVQDAFEIICCDVVGPFPVSKQGNRYVVVFTDLLSKWPEAFAVPSVEAATIARLLVDEIFARHGAPRKLLTDRGSNFLSALVKEVCRLLNTKKLNTTAYHPMGNGQTEKLNHSLIEALSHFVNSRQTDWDTFLPSVLFAYRVSPHISTGDSPFYLLFGREPRLAPDVALLPPTELSNSVEEHRRRIVSQIETAQSIARNNIALAKQNMKAQYDKRAADAPFEVGQRCWVYTPTPKKGLSKKFRHFWHGPFRICRKLSPVHYQLRTCDNRLIATTVHANRMKPFHDPADRPILPPPEDDPDEISLEVSDLPDDSFEPHDSDASATTASSSTQSTGELSNGTHVDSTDLLNDPTVYAAEKILKTRKRHGKQQYLVKWANFPVSESTWEPEENILDQRLLDNFHRNSAS